MKARAAVIAHEHRAFVERRWPALSVRSFVPIGDGWTSFTYEVNGDWIVQLPRSAYAADRLRMQAALLPRLAPHLCAPIPVPEHTSSEPAAIVYRKLEGSAARATLGGPWPEQLGRLLRKLHDLRPEDAGLRSLTTAEVRQHERGVLARLSEVVVPRLDAQAAARAQRMLRDYLDDDGLWTFAPCITHSDLGPEHVLVGLTGDLTGVLDWEEAAVHDPVMDLCWWLHAIPQTAERMLAAYGGPRDRTFDARARMRFALGPWHEVQHGVTTGDDAFVASGLAGVRARLP